MTRKISTGLFIQRQGESVLEIPNGVFFLKETGVLDNPYTLHYKTPGGIVKNYSKDIIKINNMGGITIYKSNGETFTFNNDYFLNSPTVLHDSHTLYDSMPDILVCGGVSLIEQGNITYQKNRIYTLDKGGSTVNVGFHGIFNIDGLTGFNVLDSLEYLDGHDSFTYTVNSTDIVGNLSNYTDFTVNIGTVLPYNKNNVTVTSNTLNFSGQVFPGIENTSVNIDMYYIGESLYRAPVKTEGINYLNYSVPINDLDGFYQIVYVFRHPNDENIFFIKSVVIRG